jgi:hypothetical protein
LVNIQRLDPLVGNTHERPVNIKFALPKESRKKSQRMTCQRLVDKRFLPFQRFCSAATRRGVILERHIRDLGKEFASCAHSFGAPQIASIQGLPQNELAAIGTISKIKPIRNPCIPANQLIDACARRSMTPTMSMRTTMKKMMMTKRMKRKTTRIDRRPGIIAHG